MVCMACRLCVVLLCLSMTVFGGCGGGANGKCVPNVSVACVCPSGQSGARTCTSAGTLAACVCSPPTVDAGGGADAATANSPDVAAASPPDAAASPLDAPVATGDNDASSVAEDTDTTTALSLPTIVSFDASPTAVNSGSSTTLTAVFFGGTGTVDQGIGVVTSGSGKSTGSINAATTYTLTVTNVAGGSTTAQVTVLLVVFSRTGSMNVVADATTATLLPNGKVLVTDGEGGATGYLASAELYDPATGTFTATGSLAVARQSPTATLLGNGEVLIAGGWGADGPLASAELYDPATGTFTVTGSMSVERYGDTATLLGKGKVLVDGGVGGAATHASAEL